MEIAASLMLMMSVTTGHARERPVYIDHSNLVKFYMLARPAFKSLRDVVNLIDYTDPGTRKVVRIVAYFDDNQKKPFLKRSLDLLHTLKAHTLFEDGACYVKYLVLSPFGRNKTVGGKTYPVYSLFVGKNVATCTPDD